MRHPITGKDLKSVGLDLIQKERFRQIVEEGFDEEHDEAHESGELALAAICFAAPEKIYKRVEGEPNTVNAVVFADPWPFAPEWDKRLYYGDCRDGGKGQSVELPEPGSYSLKESIDLLVKAGALIAAEIDRLSRLEQDS